MENIIAFIKKIKLIKTLLPLNISIRQLHG